jgi:multidomain signaling protein FimX
MVANIDSVFQNLREGGSVELLMIGSTPNEANQVANELRNNGQAVHVVSALTTNELAQLLETEPGDLVILKTDVPELDVRQAIDTVRASNPCAAIVLSCDQPAAWLKFAGEQEIRDMVANDDTAHLAFVIRREYQTLLLRQEMVRLRRQVQESERRFDGLMGKSRDAVAYVHEGMHIQANDVYGQMFGIEDPGEIEGLPLMDLIAPQARAQFKKTLRNLESQENFNSQVECRGSDGQQFTAMMEFSPAEIDGEPCTQIVIRDQSLQQELQARIDELTHRDPQTGLFNRQAFMEQLENAIANERMQDGAGLIQISIRNFPEIRDQAGIDKADRLLHTVADLLKEQASDAHILARFGDHDFVIMTEQHESLAVLGERCLSALRSHDFVASSGILDVPEFGIGVTPHPGEAISAHELVSRSCRITKQARSEKANQLLIYTDERAKSEQSKFDPEVVELIDHALQHDGFRLSYQPIVSLQGDTRENYSVYVRLLDENGEEQVPESFWTHAQRADRLAEIDRWVVRNAIKELVRHREDGKKINFHLALSLDGFSDESMLLWICDCLHEFKAKGAWLTFQFSEEDLRGQVQLAQKLIDDLKKINCRVAISRYEDSANSQNLLKHLQVDMVKLSPDFVKDVANDNQRQEHLSEMNQRLQSQGLKTIASGVEDANSLAVLWNVGVNYIQGYFLQEPSSNISFDDF